MKKRILVTGLYFAAASFVMTFFTGFAVWSGHGGHPPLTIADAYIFFSDWPMVLLHGSIDFEIWGGEVFLVNMIGWSLIGLLCGAWFYRHSH